MATTSISLIRACKTALVAFVALLIALIALGNVQNYDANAAFVRHVLAMDTIFPGSRLMWRAITAPPLQTAAYVTIIGWEIACAVVLIAATIRLVPGIADAGRFRAGTSLAVGGLTMILVLFGAGFLAIGGEWFLMWQSATWNGTESATRYFTVAALVVLILVAPDGSGAEPGETLNS